MKKKATLAKHAIYISIAFIGIFTNSILKAQNWYDEDWEFRRPVTISNPGGISLTDYQVMITLDNSSFNFAHANSNGSDIRVTDADELTLVPYWIEEWNAGTEIARIWIKLPSIPTSGTAAYLYYKNPAAPSISDGNSTFILFDDDWTDPSWVTTGSPTVSNGIIHFGLDQAIQSPGNYSPGNALGFKADFIGANDYKWAGFISGSSNPFTLIETDPNEGSNLILANAITENKTLVSLGPANNIFHVYELGWLNGETKAYIDHSSSPVGTLTTQVPTTPIPVTLRNYNDAIYGFDVDWLYLRKLGDTDPIPSVGDEEILCPPDPPEVTSPVTYCQGATAVPLTATGSSLLWYTTSTSGTGSPTAPTPSTTVIGTTNYYVSQTVYGCESDRAQIDVVVNEVPGAPTANVVQPTCAVPTGTITVTSTITDLSFSIDGVDYSNTTGIFTVVNPGSYNLTAKNIFDCISPETPIVMVAFPESPPSPTATLIQPTCNVATGTITITAPTGAGMTYSMDGSNYTNTSGIFTEVESGSYSLTAKDLSGCISTGTNIAIGPAPETPPTPAASVTQPTCSEITGTILVTSPTTGLSFSIDGNDYSNTTGIFTEVDPGTYDLTAKNISECVSPPTEVIVNDIPPPPIGTIAAVNSELCYGDLFYELKLIAATGPPPYNIVVDGVTSATIFVDQVFDTIKVYKSFWDNSTSGILTDASTADWELGMQFKTIVDGYIRGVRFHKGVANTGFHVGSLWLPTSATTGTKLASATFTNETASGWQEVLFDEPIAVTANTTYVVSYTDPNGKFSKNPDYFSSGFTSGNLYAFSQTESGGLVTGNGLYNITPGSFPYNNGSANYWVDVIFTTWETPPATLTSNLTSITSFDNCTNTGNPLSTATVTINPMPDGTISASGTFCENSDMSLIFNALTGTGSFSLEINGNIWDNIQSGVPFNVGTTGTNQAQSIWPSSANGSIGSDDNGSVELGVKFRSNVGGQITGIRFNKRAAQTGTFTGNLWSIGGINLATATFTGVTTSGWQQVDFATPVTIEPNVTYVASYHTPNGHYWNDQNYFLSGVTNGALTALQEGVDGENGVYAYSPTSTFPNQSPVHTNYWVDVVFVPDANNYFELTSITANGSCIKTGDPINNVSVPVYTVSTAPTSIGGTSTIEAGNSTILSVVGGSLGYNASWNWYSGSCGSTLEGIGPSIILSPIETTDYFVRAEGDCNITDCAQLTVTVTHPLTTWVGSISTDWSVAGNWSNGVPLIYTNVTVPPGPSNQPFITSSTASPSQCRDLTIEAGALVTIDAGKALTVNGTLTNNAGTTGLVIQSTLAGSGSLIHNTDGVNGIVEQYITADAWHYISSPITNAMSGVFSGIHLKPFDESIDDWGSYITALNIPLNVMQGYSAWVTSTPTTVSFEGNINNGNQSIGVTCRDYNPLVENGGWNLVGNPYPSSVDWDAAGWIKDQVDNTIYFYSGNGGAGNYFYYQGSGGLPGIGTSTMSSIVPSEQGFFVHVIDNGIPGIVNGTLGVSNSVRVHSDQAYYKKSSKNETPVIRLETSNSSNLTDEAIIRFYPEATSEHDGEYDAFKLEGYLFPQLYSITPGQSNLAINTLPGYDNETIIPLGFKSPEEGEYKITLSEFENFEPQTELYLEDLLNEVMHNFYDDPDYVFTSTLDNNTNRFLLHFSENLFAVNSLAQSSIIIYSFDKTVYVRLPENTKKAVVKIYNMMGQEVANNFIYDGLNKISLDKNTFYVVTVLSDEGIVTKKVFVR